MSIKKIKLAFELARWRYFPVGVLPVLLGTAIAWHNLLRLSCVNFIVCFIGIFFAHLASNAANDYFDELSGVDKFAYDNLPECKDSGVCGSEIITSGKLTLKEAKIIIGIFFLIALICCFILTYLVGWPILLIACIGFFLGMFYCAPPVAFGYIGYSLGEIGIFLAFGPLPVLGSYYVQTGEFSFTVLLASIPLALFTTSIVFNQHFAHVQADKFGNKKTPVVLWGEKRMRFVSKIILVAIYILIIFNVVIGVYNWYALASLLVAPVILIPAFKLKQVENPKQSLEFLFKVVKANILTTVIIIISYLV